MYDDQSAFIFMPFASDIEVEPVFAFKWPMLNERFNREQFFLGKIRFIAQLHAHGIFFELYFDLYQAFRMIGDRETIVDQNASNGRTCIELDLGIHNFG